MIKPLILIPAFNPGKLLETTVRGVLGNTLKAVWVVVDGSNDGSETPLFALSENHPRLKIILKPVNEGKGAAVRTGLKLADKEGFTHALVMDADDQHPASEIDRFFAYAETEQDAMILGQPVFDDEVPLERLYGRKLSVWMVCFELMSREVGDPLFGFRIYPIKRLLKVLENPERSNRYDFDPEVVVRLKWMGVPVIRVNAPVKYIKREQGGVSHFHYFRDNLRFILLHVRLVLESPFHWMSGPFRRQEKS